MESLTQTWKLETKWWSKFDQQEGHLFTFKTTWFQLWYNASKCNLINVQWCSCDQIKSHFNRVNTTSFRVSLFFLIIFNSCQLFACLWWELCRHCYKECMGTQPCLCRKPSLGLATKVRVHKSAGQEKSPGVWESVRINAHTPKWTPMLGVGVSGTPETSESDCKGKNPSPWRVLYIIGKIIEV
jgi:hypothetical protein